MGALSDLQCYHKNCLFSANVVIFKLNIFFTNHAKNTSKFSQGAYCKTLKEQQLKAKKKTNAILSTAPTLLAEPDI